jgi:hypothetical protein
MKALSNIVVLLIVPTFLFAQAKTKIIDMHIHSYTNSDFGGREPATDFYGKKVAANAEVHRLETFAAFKKWNIVKAVVSFNPESVENWVAKDSSHRIIRGILLFYPGDYDIDGEFGRATNGNNEFHNLTCCWVALKEKS